MEAGKRTINDLFNGNKILEIPFFQRAYVWDVPQWERFLSDMEYVSQNNKPYFLGSVILKQQLTDSRQSVGDKRTLIDGQQRLTTLNIFFKVLSLKSNNSYLSSLFRLPMLNNEIALLHNHNDNDSFQKIMNLETGGELPGEDNITNVYNYFWSKVEVDTLNFQNILTNIMFVGIDLAINDDEQQIFDTINSLGVKLTTAELLKNYFFSRDEINLYEIYWKDIFEKDNETKDYWDTEIFAGRLKRIFIDLFFYSFLQIKIQSDNYNVTTEDKLEFTKVEGLFESYKKFIYNYNVNKLQLIQEIKEYAQVFYDNFDLNTVDRELPEANGIERINAIIFGLENTTLIPYVLYVLKNVHDVVEQNRIFEYLETYIMRRMVCHENTKNYNQLFSERFIANQLLTSGDLKSFIELRADRINFIPSDNDLAYGFHNSKLINNQSAGILYFIESKIRDRQRHSTSLLGFSRYSLEHVMPKKWENHWNSVINEEDKNLRNKKLLTLGNLTLLTTSLNSSIRDAAWETKKNGRASKRGLKHFATGLDTFSQYLELDDWDESTIASRADFLCEKAKEIWKV